MLSGRNADISEESVNELEYKPEDMIILSAWRKEKIENIGEKERDEKNTVENLVHI